jgi:hypothetical protein
LDCGALVGGGFLGINQHRETGRTQERDLAKIDDQTFGSGGKGSVEVALQRRSGEQPGSRLGVPSGDHRHAVSLISEVVRVRAEPETLTFTLPGRCRSQVDYCGITTQSSGFGAGRREMHDDSIETLDQTPANAL